MIYSVDSRETTLEPDPVQTGGGRAAHAFPRVPHPEELEHHGQSYFHIVWSHL